MANDGQIVFEVTADGKHAIADIKEITRAIQQETGKWDAAAKESTDNMSNGFTNMLKKVAAGFSAVKIGKALLDVGSAAISAASDLQEVQNVVDVTFGGNANQIETWSKNAASQFGLTETMAKRFTSTMGAMLKSSGLAGEKIVDVSTDLAGLAADMASFYNLDFEEAFAKIRSGMAGMAMPLKELGIDMSVDALNAYALKQGLEKTFSQMNQGEQTMLRYQYLMSVTADAQGDFARTADGYANSTRKLESNVQALLTQLGTPFLDVVSNATNALNGFIEKLLPDESKKTVLDDFAAIDLDTEGKLSKIRKTASEARELADHLDEIATSKADKAGTKLQKMAEGLTKIDLDQGKAGIVKDFVSTLAKDIPTLANIQGTDNEQAVAWLNGIAKAANELNEDDAAAWSELLTSIKEGLPGFENTDFGASFFAALGDGFADVEKSSSVLDWAISTLGSNTNRTADEQAYWLTVCKQLVKTIPGLSSIINVETGEVKGGTQAVKDYIKAWEEGQTKLAYLQAHEQKGNVLEQEFSDLFGLKMNADIAALRIDREFKKVKDIYDKYGLDLAFDQKGNVDLFEFSGIYGGITDAEHKALEEFKNAIESSGLGKAYVDALDLYNTRNQAYLDAKEIYTEEGQLISEMGGEIEQVVDKTEAWLNTIGKTREEVQTLVTDLQNASKELADYYDSVRSNVASSIESTVKGFGKIETLAEKNTVDLTKQLEKMGERTKKNAKEWDELNQKIEDSKKASSTMSAQMVAVNLAEQAQYMKDYLDALEKARGRGISNDVLAQLSDGSVEAYDTLASLSTATDDEVEAINKNFQAVADGKKKLTDELTQQQLSVDKTYQTLQEKAQAAVAALDMEGEAKDNAGKTVKGLAEGISSHIGEVQSAVDGILEQLNRLDGWGINVNLGGFGEINFTTSAGKNADDSGRFGIDYVPRDDYLIRAHEGERLLTAQENQIWNTLLNGGIAGYDLETLGGVMRDNIKPGGNVYLDGKIVGDVISSRQGRSYKSMQRSGWQG